MTNTKKTLLVAGAVWAVAVAAATSAIARPDGGRPPPKDGARGDRREPPPPPPEAIEACEGKARGDACAFSGRDDEELHGTCWAPEDRPLACKPEGDRPPPPPCDDE